ncbi:MAG: sortase [Microgenomates group bacterium]
MLYCYVKNTPKEKERKKFLNFLPWIFLLGGLFLIINAIFPILWYQLTTHREKKVAFISPVESSFSPNFNDPHSWFITSPALTPRPSKITDYNLSIPKLGIKNAVVKIGGEDLSQSLIQYPGTALPGEYGNVVIFGHSVLPQFFNPKNYKTIFSTLPTLKKGDVIILDFDGIRYFYEVFELVEVSPEDVSVLEQTYDGEYLSLITCVPPGTYLRRLVVKAKLVPAQLYEHLGN